jgi:cytochrome c oxidase subunit III
MPASTLVDSVGPAGTGRGRNGGAAHEDGNGGLPAGASEVPQQTYLTGVAIGLGGIGMFFVALASAWVVRKGFPNSDWQPLEIPRILWLNTAVLLASSFTLMRSRHYLLHRQTEQFRHWWGVAAVLGSFFLAGQLIAWRQLAAAGIFLATNPSSSFFYVFTAAHWVHSLAGLAALIATPWWPSRRLTRDTLTQVFAIYWHFMTVVWLFLLLLLVAPK